jgi:hypothetical protein
MAALAICDPTPGFLEHLSECDVVGNPRVLPPEPRLEPRQHTLYVLVKRTPVRIEQLRS